jgi:hypothetical protein
MRNLRIPDHLRKLVETLRDYAKDVRAVYGDRLADRMLHVADDLTETMEFPRHCIENAHRGRSLSGVQAFSRMKR